MRRWIHAFVTVRDDPEALQARLLEAVGSALPGLPTVEEEEPAVDGSFLVDLPGAVLGRDVAKRVRVRPGVAHRPDTRLVLPLEWRAEPAERTFPVFEGQLEVEPLSSSHAQVTVVGSYHVPFGLLGAAADAAVLGRVAEGTAEHLVRRVADGLREPAAPAPARPERQWPLRVRDVMTPDPIVLHPDAPLRSAAQLLFHAQVSGAPVVAEDGELVGVLSERDLLIKEATHRLGVGRQAAEEQRLREAQTVGEVCGRPALVTVPDALLGDAARELLDQDVSRLVVVEQGAVVGLISRHDVLGALARDDAELEAAVQEVLAERGADDVRARVQGGQAQLDGRIELRSAHADLVDAVADVDGIMGVDADGLAWERDDVGPHAPLM